MPLRNSRSIAVATVLAQSLVACATQDLGTPPGANSADAATISADSKFNFMPSMTVVLLEVDGVPIKKSATSVSVAPGHHELVVECNVITAASSYKQTLALDAEPKAKYQLAVKVGGTGGPCQAVAEKAR